MHEPPEHSKKAEPEQRHNAKDEGAGGGSEGAAGLTQDTPRMGWPNGLSGNTVLQLQRTRGNAYVRRMMARTRAEGTNAPPILSEQHMLHLQRTHGNAYVRRMMAQRAANVQREVNTPALEKIEAYIASVPDTPTNFPGAFTELNRLSTADIRDTVLRLIANGDNFDGLLDHFGAAADVDIPKLESGFLSAILQGADPAHPTEQTLQRLAKALRVARDQLSTAVMRLPDAWRHTIVNAVPTTAQGTVKGEAEEHVGGERYVVQSSYDWQLTPTQIRVIVKFKFTGVNNPTVQQGWFDRIRNDWNVFKAVNSADATKTVDIEFVPQLVASGEHHKVEIKSGAGRDNEGEWYLGATPGDSESMRMATHEFGHTVGLKDEYQLTHGDYVATVKEQPATGATTGDATPDVIASELDDALHTGWFKAFSGQERYDKAIAVIQRHHLQQGQFAQSVATAYNNANHKGLVDDINDQLPSALQFWVVNPFTYTNSSVMGGQTEHDHPVQPRHVVDFVALVQNAKGGAWEAKNR